MMVESGDVRSLVRVTIKYFTIIVSSDKRMMFLDPCCSLPTVSGVSYNSHAG